MTTTISEQKARLEKLLTTAPRPCQRPVRTVPEGTEVETKLLEAESTSEITGEFLAKVSDYDWDRENERFDRHAFDNAIAKVKAESRAVPVLFGHDRDSTDSIVGHVPPDGWEATDDGLLARGWLDVSDAVGQRLHRMLQKGALSWSVGFSVSKASPRRQGKRVLAEVGELYELSIVPIPANGRTRTLALKGADPDEPPSDEEQRQRFADLSGEGTDAGGFFAIPTGPPSHTALHDRLVREGVLARPIDGANAASYYEPVDSNGTQKTTEEKSAHELRIARFEC
jgi:HK97 family phage prohead protease